MALKCLFFVSLLVVGLATPLAKAQLGAGLIGSLLGLIRIQGTVFCTTNGNISDNGSATPVFPNALVQLQCGTGNVVAASGRTNSLGIFSILLDPLHFLLSPLLNNCKLVVNTPLSTCNSAMGVDGILSSPLQLIENTVSGLLTIINIIPLRFNLIT
ncbi:hypothetical protein IFM89_010584 [Coptis chinensis]|uniref:Phylloplanin n=1 Tax=Coptis chinensis TaxID=261450 RepID=A0A835INR6_9MAGN|nr:hypothetical protein IFM89_010584 [Coptis chinensis]